MGRAVEALEKVFSEYQLGQARDYDWIRLPLQGGERRRVSLLPAVSSGIGIIFRIFPTFPGARTQIDSRFIMLFDGKNGQLLSLMADNDLNSARTAAPVALACRYLASPTAVAVAVVGSGHQAREQLPVIKQALPSVREVRVYSPTLEHRIAFAQEMTVRLGIPVEAVDSPRRAVEGADVIELATNAYKPLLEFEWVKPGALVISMAAKQVPGELVLRSRVISSTRRRLQEEKHEPYFSLAEAGKWNFGRLVELGQLILGQVPAREKVDDVILCELPGNPLWDAAIAQVAYTWALEKGVGTSFHISSE